MKLKRVTFTGADDTTIPAELFAISRDYPFVEWGVLVSASQTGALRFPSLDWCARFADSAPAEVKVATHVCGRWVRDFAMGTPTVMGAQIALWSRTNRVQLNFHAIPHPYDADRLAALIATTNPTKEFIFQHDRVNDGMYQAIFESPTEPPNTAPLYDYSHGAGILPAGWPKNEFMDNDVDHAWSGYAGGLSPENVLQELPKIEAAAGGDFWIDMETRVRSDDGRLFDLVKCVDVLKQVAPFVGT